MTGRVPGFAYRTLACALAIGLAPALAIAQPAGRGAPPSGPTQSRPTQNKKVGPQARGPDDDPGGQSPLRGEPQALVPQDPLAVPEEVDKRIGSDTDERPPAPTGELERSVSSGYYQETRGDYRFRFVPPLYLEHTRGVGQTVETSAGAASAEDTEGLYGMLYYRRRSAKADADVVFPLAWRLRERESRLLVLGPIAHREAPGEHDNWLAPLVFEGERKDGGYFHSPLLLTTSRWAEKSAFTVAGPYFRDRVGSDVDWGVAPFFVRGDNGNLDGARKRYTLVPPLLYYTREREIDSSKLTVVGPLIWKSDDKRDVFDVAPLYFSIRGKPESGGVRESHTTLFPFFHYGTSDEQTLFVTPAFLSRQTPKVDTLLTPLFSRSTTRSGRTSLTAIGPIAPLYMRYTDKDLGTDMLGLFPFYFGSTSPTDRILLTPLFARVENVGVSRTFWAFPNFTLTRGETGWATALHPILYLGREKEASHTIMAPFFWDFASPKGRTTIGFPAYWRFANAQEESITQVAGNTLFMQRRVAGGLDWQFHFLPVFSYGEDPTGYFWNIAFGLAGYQRSGQTARVKALWVPITVDSPKQTAHAYP